MVTRLESSLLLLHKLVKLLWVWLFAEKPIMTCLQ